MTICPYVIHSDERFLAELRERVAVEHTLAHVGRWQGWRARYRSQRKNLFDLRRCDVVDILDVLSHLPMHAEKAA